jgi:HNH endonuclease
VNRTKRLKPLSMKRKAYEEQLRNVAVQVVTRHEGKCEAILAGAKFIDGQPFNKDLTMVACHNRGTHIHHRKYRSRGGTNAPDNLINVCLDCHSWIHANPERSNALGLSLHANESEELWER